MCHILLLRVHCWGRVRCWGRGGLRRHHCQPPARSAASATTPATTSVVEVIHLDSEDSSGPDLKEAMARSLDSFQAELARQRKEDTDLVRATCASLAEARASGRKRDREEGTGSSR